MPKNNMLLESGSQTHSNFYFMVSLGTFIIISLSTIYINKLFYSQNMNPPLFCQDFSQAYTQNVYNTRYRGFPEGHPSDKRPSGWTIRNTANLMLNGW
jgi:hypothetical protein